MANTGLNGPYPLNNKGIDRLVMEFKIGAYACGYVKDETFYIQKTGRSDTDVNERLHDHVGEYASFKFGYYPTKKAAFEKECRLYHDFPGATDNKIHPARPKGTDYPCPVTDCDSID